MKNHVRAATLAWVLASSMCLVGVSESASDKSPQGQVVWYDLTLTGISNGQYWHVVIQRVADA